MAFPTATNMDQFTYVDQDPLSGGGLWTGPIWSGIDQMKVVSNAIKASQVISPAGAGSYISGINYGPGVESWITIPIMWQNDLSSVFLWMNGSGEGSGTSNGYFLYISQSSAIYKWQIFRRDSGVDTQLGADLGSQSIANGDGIGYQIISGGTHQAYYKSSGGSWSTLGSTRSDNTYTSGHIGVGKGYTDTVSVLDDFGWGTIPGAGVSFARLERGLRGLCRGVQMGAR